MMDKIALTLLIIGGLNWGSVGLFQFDLVAFACGGSASMISRVIYTLVGLSAIWCVSLLFRDRTPWRSAADAVLPIIQTSNQTPKGPERRSGPFAYGSRWCRRFSS